MEEDKVLDLKAALINKYKEFLDENRFEGGALEFDLDSFDLGEGVDKYYIDLQDIAIKPEHQGKGIGKEIVNEIKKLAEELGVPIVTNALDTEPTGFFAKQGFVFDKNMIGDFEGAMFYTPPNVTDDVIQLALSDFSSVEERVISLEDTLLEKYSDVLEFDESVLGDLDNKLPLQMNLDVDNSSILNLDVISVSQSKQNQGIGKSIMNDIIEFANANNLEIRVDSLADDFFKKMGFENYANKDGIIDEAQFRKLPDTPIQNRSNVMDYDIEDIRELFGDALDNYGEDSMPFTFLEDFAKAQGYPEEDAKRIVEMIKEGSTKSEFPKFPEAVVDWEGLGLVPEGHVNRKMFNFGGTQKYLKVQFPTAQGGIIDYKNLSVDEQNKLANNFFEGLNSSTTGSVEFYVQHQGTGKVSSGDIRYGRDVHQIPGFYTDPLGNRDLAQIRGQGTNAPLTTYYQVQVDTNNLLIDIQPGTYSGTQGPLRGNIGSLNDQISKIDWDVFAQETGVSFDDLVEATKDNVSGKFYYKDGIPHTDFEAQGFTRNIKEKVKTITGVDDIDTIAAIRKSGIEGFVTGPTNVQYEIVFLDPNDDLGYGKKINIDEVGIREFQANSSKVKNIDSFAVIPFIDETNVNVPDTVPQDLVDEVDRERLREFEELQETEGDVLYDDTDRADTFKDNLIDADDTSTAESYADIASNEELPTYEDVVNQHNQQLDNVLDNVPIEKAVKKRIRNKFAQLSARLLTPTGWLDLLDFYETAVFGLGMIVAAAPELKGIASYYSTLAANHIGKAYGMNIPVEKLEPDWERINKVMDQVEAVTPTDILINKVMDREQKGNTYVSSYLPGFLPQSTINNNDVGTTLEKTLMNMPINKDKTETSSDKLKETLIYSSNNNEGNLMEKRETLEGKLIPFNKGVFNRLDEKDKISYNESRANRLRALGREKKEKDF